MDDLISRAEAIDVMLMAIDDDWEPDYATDRMNELPSTQPEIIRCKDCKYWREYKYANGKPKYLPYCGFNDIYFREDDFCSRAKRREDG